VVTLCCFFFAVCVYNVTGRHAQCDTLHALYWWAYGVLWKLASSVSCLIYVRVVCWLFRLNWELERARVCGSTDLQSQHGVRDGGDADRASDDRVSPAVHHPLVGVRPGAVVEGRREVVAHQLRCVVVRRARTAQQARLGRIRRRQVHQGQRETWNAGMHAILGMRFCHGARRRRKSHSNMTSYSLTVNACSQKVASSTPGRSTFR